MNKSLVVIVALSALSQTALGQTLPKVELPKSPSIGGLPSGTALPKDAKPMKDAKPATVSPQDTRGTRIGGADGGGGFVGYQADKLVHAARKVVIKRLEGVVLPEFKAQPELRAWAIEGLRNLVVLPTETRERNGRELMFDYDIAQKRIYVLKPFFDLYGRISDTSIKDAESEERKFTETYLAREVAHFWNQGDDIASDEFAEALAIAPTKSELEQIVPFVEEARTVLQTADRASIHEAELKLVTFEIRSAVKTWSPKSRKLFVDVSMALRLAAMKFGRIGTDSSEQKAVEAVRAEIADLLN